MDLLFTRVVTASVLLWIAPNITKAGLIEMVKTPTAPCDGCYFAVFDKVKKEYRLKYITPNVPDMKEVVDKKQEVIWINAQGDYSPYWNVPENWGKDDNKEF
ncbi:MAG: hypothetical protein KDI39_11760 [Pseudomonadales bacterium]|nr:hypothetical protein [Pseudomonadales bacterium]